jgi:hypothetical protein
MQDMGHGLAVARLAIHHDWKGHGHLLTVSEE